MGEDFKTSLMASSIDLGEPPPSDMPTILSTSGQNLDPLTGRNLKNMNRNTSPSLSSRPIEEIPTIIGEQKPLEETDDEEEQRRRLAYFNRIAPMAAGGVAGAATFEMQNMVGQAPGFQRVPDPGSASMLAGTPQNGMQQNFAPFSNSPDQYFAGNNFAQNAPPVEQYTPQPYYSPVEAPYAPSFPPYGPPYTPPLSPGSFTTTPPPFPASPKSGSGSGLPKGCALWGAILLVPTLILVSLLSLSVTIFAPTIVVNGTTSVMSSGDTLHLHGHGFLANAAVTLTVDDARPVQLVSQSTSSQLVQQQPLMQSQTLLLATTPMLSAASGTSTVKAGANGTFDAAIMVNTIWLPGKHQVHAQENFSPRVATLSFTILGQGDTLPPASTTTPTPDNKPTPTATNPTATPTPVSTTPGVVPTPIPTPVVNVPPTSTPTINSQLASLTPTTLSLGTLIQGSTQTLTGQTTLNASGNALVSWMASWNQQQATWLQVSPSSGQISTPGSQQIAVTASAGTLQPGAYSTTVSFSSPFNAQPLTLTVSFTVQGTCLKGNPSRLTFTGTVGSTDPAPQTVKITNCGAAGPWSATASTKDLATWLSVNPNSGTLATNASQTATVSTNIANLVAGTYSGTVTFTNGTNQFKVAVTLNVQAAATQSPPAIQASKMAFNLTQDCTSTVAGVIIVNFYVCTLTLTSVNAQQSLAWTSTTTGAGIATVVTPASGTIAPGIPTTVTITLRRAVCPGTNDTVTFASPDNSFASITVTFSC